MPVSSEKYTRTALVCDIPSLATRAARRRREFQPVAALWNYYGQPVENHEDAGRFFTPSKHTALRNDSPPLREKPPAQAVYSCFRGIFAEYFLP